MKKSKKIRVKQLLQQPLPITAKIAFNCSYCLGDSLIGLVTVNNLIRNGYDVTVYGDFVYALQPWFPQFKAERRLDTSEQEVLRQYDVVLHMYDTPLSAAVSTWHPQSITLSDSELYLADMTMTDIHVMLCQQEFQLKNTVRENAIQPLSGLEYRKNSHRIIIHPTSSLLRKNWPARKFRRLAKRLLLEGYSVTFIVSPEERPDWEGLVSEGIDVPKFASLSDVAAYIYESGFFIGNDSGIGHLASNLGIPTVSIILRKGVAKQWRPTWAPGKVVLSPSWLNPRPIKEKLWKIFTTITAVKTAFDQLKKETC